MDSNSEAGTIRYPASQTAEKHEKILREAARLFRERGFDAAGVAEIMKAAGLTHGAFYAHFTSKDALETEAVARAFRAIEQPHLRSDDEYKGSKAGLPRQIFECSPS